MKLTLAMMLFAAGITAAESFIGIVDPPSALTLTFSNLPPRWQVESTRDLTNWFTIVISGDIPPSRLEFSLTNAAQAQFYRLIERP